MAFTYEMMTGARWPVVQVQEKRDARRTLLHRGHLFDAYQLGRNRAPREHGALRA